MPSARFEPATPATKRPQTYALDRAATEVGLKKLRKEKIEASAWKLPKISPSNRKGHNFCHGTSRFYLHHCINVKSINGPV
jgi:hypothetical protein